MLQGVTGGREGGRAALGLKQMNKQSNTGKEELKTRERAGGLLVLCLATLCPISTPPPTTFQVVWGHHSLRKTKKYHWRPGRSDWVQTAPSPEPPLVFSFTLQLRSPMADWLSLQSHWHHRVGKGGRKMSPLEGRG